jgi:glycosyl transferase family 4
MAANVWTQRAETRSNPMRFAVVAWSDAVPVHLSPRGQRTQHLVNALAPYGEVERLGEANVPQWLAGNNERTTSSWYRRLARTLMHRVLIDKYEIIARRSLRNWCPEVDAAVLIGFPWSPLPSAALKLARRQIPYIVDVGDPWILTNPDRESGRFVQSRAARRERKLWASAHGVVVTTQGQGEELRRLFPRLRVLVRPNGYNTVATEATFSDYIQTENNDKELRLVHYGSIHGPRVKFGNIFERLANSGKWSKITLYQYGPDWENALKSIPADIEIKHRSPISWTDVLAGAHTFDAAVVIGWRNPTQMPSKTVQYLTLPIPRIAMTSLNETDALATYVEDKPGWAIIDDGDSRAPEIIATHLAKPWRQVDLEAPKSESWEAVESVLRDFALDMIATRSQ